MIIGVSRVVAMTAVAAAAGVYDREEAAVRSLEPVTVAVREMAELHVAEARYTTLVEFEYGSAGLPRWLSGERTVLYAVGDVAAVVNLTTARSPSAAERGGRTGQPGRGRGGVVTSTVCKIANSAGYRASVVFVEQARP